jgi:autotransporter-associated beta strand protein
MDALTGAGTIDNSSGTSGGSFTFGVGGTTGDFSGVLAGTAANKNAWTKQGTGTQTFSGSSANTSTGLMTVSAGELRLNKTGVNAIAGNLTISGGTVRLMQSNQIVDSSALSLTSGTLDFGDTTDTVGIITATTTAGSAITGTTGTLTTTRLNVNGTAQMTGGNVIAGVSERGLVIGSGATGSFTLSGGKLTSTGGGSFFDVITNNNTGTFIINGGEYVNTGTLATNIGTGATASPATFTISSGTAAIGTLALNTANNAGNSNAASRISTINLDGGTLELSTVSVSNVAAGGSATLNFNGGTLKAGASTLSLSGFTTGGLFIKNGGAIIDSNGYNVSINNALQKFSGATTDTLIKRGAGILTLGAANTYSGATTVEAGTLALGAGGSISSSTTIDVKGSATLDVSALAGWALASGQTLKGTGSVAAGGTGKVVTISSGAFLAPGASPGTLLVNGDLSLAGGSTFVAELQNAGSLTADLVNLAGDLDILSGALLDLQLFGSDATLANGTKYSLFSYSGSWNSGTFNGYADDSDFTFGLNQFRIDYNDTTAGLNGGSYSNFVTLTVVPEPRAALLASLGLLALLRRRRAA